jgi:hypothetical protein
MFSNLFSICSDERQPIQTYFEETGVLKIISTEKFQSNVADTF